jgi:hypothetical protein
MCNTTQTNYIVHCFSHVKQSFRDLCAPESVLWGEQGFGSQLQEEVLRLKNQIGEGAR